jgi:hypothetical protein
MPADRCRADGCAKSGSYGRGCCGEHYFAELRAANPRDMDALRAAADPARHAVTRAAAAAPATVTHTRPVALVLACPCGRRHPVPAAALGVPVQVRCGRWLKPALTVKGA